MISAACWFVGKLLASYILLDKKSLAEREGLCKPKDDPYVSVCFVV